MRYRRLGLVKHGLACFRRLCGILFIHLDGFNRVLVSVWEFAVLFEGESMKSISEA